MLNLKEKLICLKRRLIKHKNELANKENNEIKRNIRDDIIKVIFNEESIVIDIKDNCDFMDYTYTIDKCYNKLNDTFIPIKILITNGGNIFNWILFRQKLYILKNNKCDYMISVSDNIIRISQTILKDDLYYETELDYKINEKEFTVYKLIHDLNRSTKCPKWYPEEESSNFYLDKYEAKEMLENLFDNLEEIKNIDNIIMNLNDIKNNIYEEFSAKISLKK